MHARQRPRAEPELKLAYKIGEIHEALHGRGVVAHQAAIAVNASRKLLDVFLLQDIRRQQAQDLLHRRWCR